MKESHVISYALAGTTPHRCVIHTAMTEGIGIHVVGGIRDSEVKELLLRVATGLCANGFTIPGKKIIIEVSFKEHLPSGEKERIDCQTLDLPVALSLLIAAEKIHHEGPIFASGNLMLNGSLQGATLATAATLSHPDSLASLENIFNHI